MDKSAKIFVAGHAGLVGAAVVRVLRRSGYENILCATRAQLDLTDQRKVLDFFARERPRALINCAAVVGGIVANRDYPGDFIGANLIMQSNIFEAARRSQTEKVLFIASGCIYPRETPLPTREEHLLTAPLEPTNQWYAVAKIAGVKTCEAYRAQYGMNIVSLMPCNLYGEQDNFDLETSHVLPALVRKFHQGRQGNEAQVTVWGSGRPLREFLHVDDLGNACVLLLEKSCPHALINVGSSEETTIAQLAQQIKEAAGYEGEIVFDASRPDGPPRKLLDNSKMRALGWQPRISLREGLARTYDWYAKNQAQRRETNPAAWRNPKTAA